MRPIAMVTALCLALVAWPAWAAPTVMVWPATADAPIAEAERALRQQGVEVIARTSVRHAIGRHRAARLELEDERRRSVEDAFARAETAYLELEIESMTSILLGAEADAVGLARPGRCDGLWELQFRLGLAHWATGTPESDEEARVRHELALALDPSRRPLGELYGPSVTAVFLEAVARRSGRVARSVSLRLSPADARVEIDCRARSKDGLELRPGLHAVRVSAPGHEPWSGVVDLRERDVLEVSLVPRPADEDPALTLAMSTESDPRPEDTASSRAAVWAVAHDHGADAVLVVGAGSEGWRVRPWGRDGIGATVERGELDEALRAALRLLDEQGRLTTPPPIVADGSGADPGPAPGPERKPVLRTWWFWTIVGGVVLTGAAVGVGLGLRDSSAAPGRLVVVAK